MLNILKAPVRPIWHRYIAHRDRIRLVREEREKRDFLADGGTYIDWYAKRLNRLAKNWDYEQVDKNPYMMTGKEHLDALISAGMQPHHSLFEIGTGWGRSAQHFIGYLEMGNYVGCDPSGDRLAYARYYLDKKDLAEKKYEIIVNTENSLSWLKGRQFDFIWAQSVFNHMPIEDVREVFSNLHIASHSNTVFMFSHVHTPQNENETLSAKNFWHSFDDFLTLGQEFGYEVTDVTHYLAHMEPKNWSQSSGLLHARPVC